MLERNGFALAGRDSLAGIRVIGLLLAGRAHSGRCQALRITVITIQIGQIGSGLGLGSTIWLTWRKSGLEARCSSTYRSVISRHRFQASDFQSLIS